MKERIGCTDVLASDILVMIGNKEPLIFKNINIIGNLDITKLDLPLNREGKRVLTSPIAITESVINGRLIFENIVLESSINFSGTRFRNYANFDNVQFDQDVNFEHSFFEYDASFNYTIFGGLYRQKTILPVKSKTAPTLYLSQKEIAANEPSSNKLSILCLANFAHSKFSQNANFNCARFLSPVKFGQSSFCGGAYFNRARFEFLGDSESSDFSRVIFGGNANFESVQFNGEVNFSHTRFAGQFLNADPGTIEEKILQELAKRCSDNAFGWFRWDEIPGEDNGRLIEFLRQRLAIYWAKTAKIEKIESGKTIEVYTENKCLSLKLSDKKTDGILEIDDGRIVKFIAKMENNNLNIYFSGNSEELEWCFVDFTHTRFNRDADFSHVTFWCPLSFTGAEFFGDAEFRQANFGVCLFCDDVDFEKAHFNSNVGFSYAQFNGNTNFGRAIFGGLSNEEDTSFDISEKDDLFDSASRHKNLIWHLVDFTYAKFNFEADFSRTEFRTSTDFSAAKFDGRANFSQANFEVAMNCGGVDFGGAHFNEIANFKHALSASDASLKKAYFIKSAEFRNEPFSGIGDGLMQSENEKDTKDLKIYNDKELTDKIERLQRELNSIKEITIDDRQKRNDMILEALLGTLKIAGIVIAVYIIVSIAVNSAINPWIQKDYALQNEKINLSREQYIEQMQLIDKQNSRNYTIKLLETASNSEIIKELFNTPKDFAIEIAKLVSVSNFTLSIPKNADVSSNSNFRANNTLSKNGSRTLN